MQVMYWLLADEKMYYIEPWLLSCIYCVERGTIKRSNKCFDTRKQQHLYVLSPFPSTQPYCIAVILQWKEKQKEYNGTQKYCEWTIERNCEKALFSYLYLFSDEINVSNLFLKFNRPLLIHPHFFSFLSWFIYVFIAYPFRSNPVELSECKQVAVRYRDARTIHLKNTIKTLPMYWINSVFVYLQLVQHPSPHQNRLFNIRSNECRKKKNERGFLSLTKSNICFCRRHCYFSHSMEIFAKIRYNHRQENDFKLLLFFQWF